MTKSIEERLLYLEPKCVKRLGADTFLKLPLFQASVFLEPIYVNKVLFKKIFKNKPSSWEDRSATIKHLFSITLDKTQSTGQQCGWAYVDRQAEDMYQTSLSGNQGSGRAYYTGPNFNIKGEKTPLATSTSPLHSSGTLSMEDGLWSALIGNSLFNELAIKPSPILTILRIDQTTCRIVRIDMNGSLDRITHLLYQQKKLSKYQFLKTTQALARFEADKFIMRIFHGAWSAGNASLSGHLIDYDTVCAVKGRQPQYTLTSKYVDNFFGFEHEGQLLILEGLRKEQHFTNHTRHFYKGFQEQLCKGLVYLMGFENVSLLTNELRTLVDLFYELSHYTYYANEKSLFANYSSSLFFHLFDFSTFFRVYPFLKLLNQFTPQRGLNLLIYSPQQEALRLAASNEDHDLIPAVKERLNPFLLYLDEPLSDPLKQQALQFIEMYESLNQQLLKRHSKNPYTAAIRAYIINEDRIYLYPVFSIEGLLIKWQSTHTPKTIHRFIQRLIQANQRYPIKDKQGYYPCNMRVFMEGITYSLIHPEGKYRVVIFYDETDRISSFDKYDQWTIEVRGEPIPATLLKNKDGIQLISDDLPITQLIASESRDSVFKIPNCVFYHNNTKIKLTDFFFPHQNEGYYL